MHSPFPKQAIDYTCLQYKSIENTVDKGEIVCYKCLLPILKTLCHFPHI